MGTVICDKTGIAFEAASKRQKNHPKVSSFLNYAASTKCQRGAYGVALEEFATCKSEHMTDIDAVLARVRGVVEEFNQTASEAEWHRIQLKKNQEKQQQEAKKARRLTNELLNQYGYHWQSSGFASEEDADFFGGFQKAEIGLSWTLYDLNEQPVSIQQAMQAIAVRGDSRATKWLEENK